MKERVGTKKKKKNNIQKVLHMYRWENIILAIFGVAIILFLASSFFAKSHQQTIKTAIVDFGVVESVQEKSMVIVRNDKVITAGSEGFYELIYPDGERVKKGIPVAKSKAQGSSEDYRYMINIVDNRIAEVNNNSVNTNSGDDLSKINNRLEYLYKNTQSRIRNGETEYVEKLKKEIISLNDKKQILFPNEKGLSKSELVSLKNKLQQEMNNKSSIVYSSAVGVVSSYYDGNEELFKISNIKNLTVGDINKAKNAANIDYSASKQKGDVVAVISENFKWYLACEVDEKDIDNIASETPVYIEIEDTRFRAYLEDFFKGTDGKFVGYFRVEDEKFNFYEKRKYDAGLILKSSDGLIIPNDAVITKDGVEGVFVVDITGVARFVPIGEIDAKNDKFTGIKYDPAEQKGAEVLKLYDEVITNPNGVKDGQRVR